MSNDLLEMAKFTKGICNNYNKEEGQNSTRIEVHIPDPGDSKIQNLFPKRPNESYVALKKHFDHNLKFIKV